jgi:hypothetical protein
MLKPHKITSFSKSLESAETAVDTRESSVILYLPGTLSRGARDKPHRALSAAAQKIPNMQKNIYRRIREFFKMIARCAKAPCDAIDDA